MQTRKCPKCYSENTSSFEMAHKSSGKLLSEETAPPKQPMISFAEFLGIVIGSFFIIYLVVISPYSLFGMNSYRVGLGFSLLIATAYIILRRLQVRNKMEMWNYEIEKWNRSWMCLKCGAVFYPEETAKEIPQPQDSYPAKPDMPRPAARQIKINRYDGTKQ